MEVEAKFALPGVETFQRLQAIDSLAEFVLSAHQVQQVRDTYLDTDGRRILSAGYACRKREREGEVLVTLKGVGRAEGAIHRREEMEISLPSYRPPVQWPDGPMRDRICQLIGDAPLIPLFELQQTRVLRRVSRGEMPVAELSLDNVLLFAGQREQTYFELEIELIPQGTESDLTRMVHYLQEEWGLEPETHSKFERALAFLSELSLEEALLTPRERAICLQIAKRDDLYAQRAEGLLALDEGVTQLEVAKRAERSKRTVRRWLAAFRDERLGIFPDGVLEEVLSAPLDTLPDFPTRQTESPQPQPWSLEMLFEQYNVDRAHARVVADHALVLFDYLSPLHGLPQERRFLLEIAALVHNIGLETDPGHHHKVGRDILLSHPLAGLDDQERLMVALTTFLHRRRLTSKKLEKKLSKSDFSDLLEPARAETLALAALVRLADGLDYSQTGSSELGQVRQEGEHRVEIEVTGPYAAIDAAQAQEKSDLWHLLFDVALDFESVQPTLLEGVDLVAEEAESVDLSVAAPLGELPERPGLSVGDTMAEAACKTFAFHFQRMLYYEPGTRLGEDIEDLHDMRVATRRMRAAFQVFGDYLDMERLKPILKGLRRTGRRLGSVRDLDVFWEKAQRYLDTLPPERQSELDPLREAWKAERERAREKMLAYLDSERYVQFKTRFEEFLRTSSVWTLPTLTKKGEAVPHRLRHVVPVVVYQRLAGVQAYDEWVTRFDVPLARLHRLRIAAKRLRYTLEFLEEVLAPQTKDLIKEIKGLQDHLGDLQDAVVASGLLRDFLTWGTWGHAKKGKVTMPTEPVIAPGVAIYLAQKQAELQHLLETFPQAWSYFNSSEFKQVVAIVVAPL